MFSELLSIVLRIGSNERQRIFFKEIYIFCSDHLSYLSAPPGNIQKHHFTCGRSSCKKKVLTRRKIQAGAPKKIKEVWHFCDYIMLRYIMTDRTPPAVQNNALVRSFFADHGHWPTHSIPSLQYRQTFVVRRLGLCLNVSFITLLYD
jgi:hypothetical protein